jgi:hypothetical protein
MGWSFQFIATFVLLNVLVKLFDADEIRDITGWLQQKLLK